MFNARSTLVVLTLCFFSFVLHAATQEGTYTRDFWRPAYHTERLAYCLMDGTTCGKPVATQYCHIMGYETLVHETIEHNVGLTHYMEGNSACRGWGCDGFKLIQCANKIIHKPAAPYYYRLKQFDYPRFAHYRVAWCMKQHQQCGKPAAYSFCRRLGYEKVHSFKQDKHVPATRTLGDEVLCFGSLCRGFREIVCYR